METEKILDSDFGNNGLSINGQSHTHLVEIAKWGRFLSILGLILIGLLIVGFIYMLISRGSLFGAEAFQFFITFAIIMLLYIFPIFKLYNFSINALQALNVGSDQQLSTAFGALKSLFRFVGVSTMVVLIIYGSALLFGGMAYLFG